MITMEPVSICRLQKISSATGRPSLMHWSPASVFSSPSLYNGQDEEHRTRWRKVNARDEMLGSTLQCSLARRLARRTEEARVRERNAAYSSTRLNQWRERRRICSLCLFLSLSLFFSIALVGRALLKNWCCPMQFYIMLSSRSIIRGSSWWDEWTVEIADLRRVDRGRALFMEKKNILSIYIVLYFVYFTLRMLRISTYESTAYTFFIGKFYE